MSEKTKEAEEEEEFRHGDEDDVVEKRFETISRSIKESLFRNRRKREKKIKT